MATIRKRGNAWNAQIRRKGHPAQSRSFDTKIEAEVWVREVEHEMDSGEFVSVQAFKDTTVGDVLDKYAEHIQGKLACAAWTANMVKTMHATEEFLKVAVCDFTPQMLKAWVTRRGTEVKSSSVNRELNVLGSAFKFGIREMDIPLKANPVSLITRPKNPRSRDQRWSDEDLVTVTNHFGNPDTPTTPKTWVPFIMTLALETAMRRGEIFKLVIDNIDLEQATAYLPTTKNEDPRMVPLSRKAVATLTLMIGERRHGPLIPFSIVHFSRMLRIAVLELDLGHLRFHDVRREATTRMADKLTNVLELSAVTGHRDLNSLQTYYKPKASDLARKLG